MKYPLETCMGSRVRVISRKIDNIYRKHLGNSGVTENQLSILMAIYKTGLIEQKGIGEFLSLEKSSLSRNLVRLTQAKYVVKTGPINRPELELTLKGKEKVESLIPAWEQAMDEVHEVLDAEGLNGFNRFEQNIAKL